MKILHIIFTLNIGGAETMLVDIVNEQCKTEKVMLVIIDDCYNSHLVSKISSSVEMIQLHRKSGSKSLLPFVRLNALILSKHPDIIHIHNWQTPKVLLPWIHPIFTVHGLGRPSKYYHRLRGLVAISEAVKEDILSLGNYDVDVIPNGVVVDRIIAKKELKKETWFKIIQVGRLTTEIKGQDVLIKAIALLREQGYTNISLDIVGEGESKDEIKELVERLQLKDCVKLLGVMTRGELYSCLREYDLLCQPSRKEGFGLTVVEAMVAKVPVLVSNNGGPYEIIEAGRLGYSFVSGDSLSCANEIKCIMLNYGNEQMNAMVENSYYKAVNEYSICRMVKKYIDFYKKRESKC